MFEPLSINDVIFILRGAGVTLAITFWSILFGTALGVICGIVRSEAPWLVSAALGAFLDIFRSVPLLIQLVLVNSMNAVIGTRLTIFQIASTVLAVYAAAYCTELVRAAILAVPSATRRASRSLGLTYLQDLREIVFPIAGKVFLPNWISLTLAVMKDTSLVLWIGSWSCSEPLNRLSLEPMNHCSFWQSQASFILQWASQLLISERRWKRSGCDMTEMNDK